MAAMDCDVETFRFRVGSTNMDINFMRLVYRLYAKMSKINYMQKISKIKKYIVETSGITMKVHNYTKNIYQIKNKYTNLNVDEA